MSLGLYVHIPFCQAKCKYCDFTSQTNFSLGTQDEYLKALLQEGEMYRQALAKDKTILSVFIGGGTPTCLTSGRLVFLVKLLRRVFNIQMTTEWTVEANPGTLDKEKLTDLKAEGVNRLSLGMQAWQSHHLARLGRIHTQSDIIESVKLIKEVGFTNYNLDLMYGLPHQTLAEWEETLKKTISLEPTHISLYQLKIEEGTFFAQELEQGRIEEFDNELASQMYLLAIKILENHGYQHYEISNFAKFGYECFHNKVYWINGEYLGLGVAAASHINNRRFTNLSNLQNYYQKLSNAQFPIDHQEEIPLDWQMAETMFLGLRLRQGVNNEVFKERYKLELNDIYGEIISKFKKLGLLAESRDHVYLTTQGLLQANEVMAEFLP